MHDKITILFDGVCYLCMGSIKFIIKRDSNDVFRFASIQSQEGRQLLKKHQVAVVPGEVFGESGKNCVRMCYATSMNELEEAITRIKKFIQ